MTSRGPSVPPEVRPGTGRVRVTELKHADRVNPTPVTRPCEDVETAADLLLSPEKLEWISGTDDLSHVSFLQARVDTSSNSLGNFGAFLPRLVQLKLNNSTVTSVRDLGTSVPHLQVLWLSRCCLKDLDGISTFTSLQELYVSYNYVSELSGVGMLENLRLLDLEGNDVDDLVQVQYLGLCGGLRRLTLEGNPVCSRPSPAAAQAAGYSYRAAVMELIPQLRYLDDVRVEEGGLGCCSAVGGDWDVFRDSIRGSGGARGATAPADDEDPADGARPRSRTASPGLPPSWTPPGSGPPAGTRPWSAAGPWVPPPSGSRLGSADSRSVTAAETESSTLTHGAGPILFCGNPVQAVRAKREKLRTAPARSTPVLYDLPAVPTPRSLQGAEPSKEDVFGELRAWREQHSRRLEAVAKERSPQVLTIRHPDGGGEPDSDGVSGIESDASDEERGGGEPVGRASLDSSLRSVSPGRHGAGRPSRKMAELQEARSVSFSGSDGEAVSPDAARLSASLDCTPSPPPLIVGAAAAPRTNRTTVSLRVRRLRPGRADPELFLHPRSPGTRTPHISRTNV